MAGKPLTWPEFNSFLLLSRGKAPAAKGWIHYRSTVFWVTSRVLEISPPFRVKPALSCGGITTDACSNAGINTYFCRLHVANVLPILVLNPAFAQAGHKNYRQNSQYIGQAVHKKQGSGQQ